MATVIVDGPFVFNRDPIPPRGTMYFWLANSSLYKDCTVTVTAHGLAGLTNGPHFLEVVQTATRSGPGPNEHHLDIVVRNNTDRQCPYVKVYVSVIKP